MYEIIPVSKEKCELDGPYECTECGGQMMIDLTFINAKIFSTDILCITCPYCETQLSIPE